MPAGVGREGESIICRGKVREQKISHLQEIGILPAEYGRDWFKDHSILPDSDLFLYAGIQYPCGKMR